MRKGNTVSDEVLIATYNKKNRTVSDEHLSDIFAEVGRRYGYVDVEAQFVDFKDFKVRWQRTSRWISFTISDYLDRAPDDVLQSLAEVLFSKMEGSNRPYDEAFVKYITDPKLSDVNRKDFFARSKNLNGSSIGTFHDLVDCVNRLREQRLIPADIHCELSWDNSGSDKVAGCSVLQRAVWVSNVLDQKGVPENVLDYAVYAMMCHLMAGYGAYGQDEYEYQRLLSAYPMIDEAEEWLDTNGLYL